MNENDDPESMAVQVGISDGVHTEITSSHLKPGDPLIVVSNRLAESADPMTFFPDSGRANSVRLDGIELSSGIVGLTRILGTVSKCERRDTNDRLAGVAWRRGAVDAVMNHADSPHSGRLASR